MAILAVVVALLLLPSCSTVPITDRKQLSIIPESRINRQAAAAYENFRSKSKLITNGSQLREIREIGKKMEFAVSTFFKKQGKEDPTKILVGIMFLWIMIK